jgi:hypothetical protein
MEWQNLIWLFILLTSVELLRIDFIFMFIRNLQFFLKQYKYNHIWAIQKHRQHWEKDTERRQKNKQTKNITQTTKRTSPYWTFLPDIEPFYLILNLSSQFKFTILNRWHRNHFLLFHQHISRFEHFWTFLSFIHYWWTVHPSGAPEFTSGFKSGLRCSILVFNIKFCKSLFVLLFFFLLAIILSVLYRLSASDYPFGTSNFSLDYIYNVYIYNVFPHCMYLYFTVMYMSCL